MKVFHLFLTVVFIIFAGVQYNDPDFYIWVPVYLAIAYLPFTKLLGRPNPLFARVAGLVLLIWIISYFPAMMKWINDGMPTITGTMKAESPHIELIREVLGLFICLIVSFFYSRH